MEKIFGWVLGGVLNWKTTIAGILGGVFMVLSAAGLIDVSQPERDSVIAAIVIIIGWFAKDHNGDNK